MKLSSIHLNSESYMITCHLNIVTNSHSQKFGFIHVLNQKNPDKRLMLYVKQQNVDIVLLTKCDRFSNINLN